MPFVVKPYAELHRAGKAQVGDTVHLISRPDVAMTVSNLPPCNYTAGHRAEVLCVWLDPRTCELRRGQFFADELSR